MQPTPSQSLAEQYVKLGGKRKSKMDDNATSVRKWEDDTPEAEEFWQSRIETLPKDERVQVEKFLPSINAI